MKTIADNSLSRIEVLQAQTVELIRSRQELQELSRLHSNRRHLDLTATLRLTAASIGFFPVAAIVVQLFSGAPNLSPVVLFLFALAAFTTPAAGYIAASRAAGLVERTQNFHFINRIAAIALIGGLWGMASGFAGGVVIFGIGAIFGALIGFPIGAITLPIVFLAFNALKQYGKVELRRLLPLALTLGLIFALLLTGFQ